MDARTTPAAPRGTLYTWGYDASRPADLARLARSLAVARVIDVRSIPHSRRPGFGCGQLAASLGTLYEKRGDRLGGRGEGATAAGLAELARELDAGRDLLIVCKEDWPGHCHRHRTIALPLARRGYRVEHLWRAEGAEMFEAIEARELHRSIEANAGTDYACDHLVIP